MAPDDLLAKGLSRVIKTNAVQEADRVGREVRNSRLRRLAAGHQGGCSGDRYFCNSFVLGKELARAPCCD